MHCDLIESEKTSSYLSLLKLIIGQAIGVEVVRWILCIIIIGYPSG